MTTHDRDKIIAAAKEAGLEFLIDQASELLGLFYAIAFEDGRQAEREECAKICDKYTEFSGSPSNFAENCAKAIRARGDMK